MCRKNWNQLHFGRWLNDVLNTKLFQSRIPAKEWLLCTFCNGPADHKSHFTWATKVDPFDPNEANINDFVNMLPCVDTP